MALTSPGVEVTVIDESFYTPAEPGTTPLIVVATGQDKLNGAGTGTAQATLADNIGNVYKVTSQKELVDLFGVPFFEKTASSTPIHGSELNEYGLLAAYSLLGVSNAAFIARANVNVTELTGEAEAPGANPEDGTWWIDTRATTWGIQEWNNAAITTAGGQKFSAKTPIVLTDADETRVTGGVPNGSVGAIGNYAIVFQTVDGTGSFTASRETAKLYYKTGVTVGGNTAGDWVLVGSKAWALSHYTVESGQFTTVGSTGNLIVNGNVVSVTSSDTPSTLAVKVNGVTAVDPDVDPSGVFAVAQNGRLYFYTNADNDQVGDSALANSIVFEGDAAVKTALGLGDDPYYGPALVQAPHTEVPQWKSAGSGQTNRPTGSVWIKTTEPGAGARWRAKKWNTASASWVAYDAPIYGSTNASLYNMDRSGGGANLAVDQLTVQYNADEQSGYDDSPATAKFRVWRRIATGSTVITSSEIGASSFTTGGANTFTIAESLKGQSALDTAVSISFTPTGANTDADLMAAAINSAGLTNIEASVNDDYQVSISHTLGGDFRISDGSNSPIAAVFSPYNINTEQGTANFYNLTVGSATNGSGPLAPGATDDYLASNWRPLAADNFYASANNPENEPADGRLWYNPEFSDVDMMIHDGSTWVGYRDTTSPYAESASDRVGFVPVVSASNPYVDGVTETGDIWISTADLENYPTIYKYNSLLSGTPASERWVLVDKTDQVSEDGILFADARYGESGATGNTAATIKSLANNSYLDPDAPDPALYPQGMLLWNLRRSGGNVKRYVNNYIDITEDNVRYNDEAMSGYATDRWVTASPNKEDGSGNFGRKAQRSVIVAALKSFVDTNDQIRDEERRNFNLIAAPGYPELMSNLVNLNIDRGITAFVVGDTPLRLASDATTLTNWGSNAALVTDNGDDGIVTYDEYMGVFYPNGFTTDLSGSNAVVPASHMMMRTIALSDQVSYPWFAPAGTRRGGISNATAVGYIDSLTGEFQTVALNEGQRDTLYDLKINPIPFFNGVGLVNYGQKTRARNASALDRINVARLVVYLRSQLNKLARPYIFEPNDKITRDEIKQSVESLLLELVGLRAIYDFAVVCDETNNTPARIDRNELYVDVAIEPVKAVEFIYIPLRVKNTGEI